MKTGQKFLIAILILSLIAWAIYSFNKSQDEKRKAELRAAQLGSLTTNQPPRGQGLATVLGAFFPFLM